MPSIAGTAYPRLKSHFTDKELREFYTPTQEEIKFAVHHTRMADTRLNFLILLKKFQRLVYFGVAELKVKTSQGTVVQEELQTDSRPIVISHMLDNLSQGETQVIDDPGEINIVGHRVVHGGEFLVCQAICGRL